MGGFYRGFRDSGKIGQFANCPRGVGALAEAWRSGPAWGSQSSELLLSKVGIQKRVLTSFRGVVGICWVGMSSQTRFETVYRGRQSWLHHAAYMRVCKVLLARRVLRLTGVRLEDKSIFDYGFGAGTFFRYCPHSAHLLGVEQDPVVVEEAAEMLRTRGFSKIDLQTIGLENWREHTLWQHSYDVFLCSHVLEHLENPVEFLQLVRPTLGRTGVFVGLVPINERAINPHHLQLVNEKVLKGWVAAAGYDLVRYEENDPFLYWAQPLFTATHGWKHRLAQLISLDVGLSATVLGERIWFLLGRIVGRLTFSKPTQAVFLLRPKNL